MPMGAKANWCRDFVIEDGSCFVLEVGVNKLTDGYSVSEEGLAVCEMGVGEAGIGGSVEPEKG